MAVEKDQSRWLPEPPPPRPARRDAAIDAALRKFDGVENVAPPGRREPPRWRTAAHRPAVAVLVSAMLLFVVGIPAALIGIREARQAPVSGVHTERLTSAPKSVQPAANIPAPKAPTAAKPPFVAPISSSPIKDVSTVAKTPRAKGPVPVAPPPLASAPSMMAAAPPPPPPAANEVVGQVADNLAVTGSRVQKSAEARNAFESKVDPAQPYATFLSRLQAAVRADDRRGVMALIAFPLRVNTTSGSRLYGAPSALRDYDRIFTPKVRRAILNSSADRIFVRDIGAMVGNGEVWFRENCPNDACSPTGPVRIVAVNP